MKRFPSRRSSNRQPEQSGTPASPSANLNETFRQAYPLARRAIGARAAAAVATRALFTHDAQDLEQECMLACWQALAVFDPSRASLRTFVERVVAARLVSLHRARVCRPRLLPFEDDGMAAPDSWVAEIEFRSDVCHVLSALSDTDRRIVLTLAEHTPTEAMRILGIARSTVYERLRHIRTAFASAGVRPERGPRC